MEFCLVCIFFFTENLLGCLLLLFSNNSLCWICCTLKYKRVVPGSPQASQMESFATAFNGL